MRFHEKLDLLMTLTDITNSKLSKDANIDPSLISRWRRGVKVPALHSDAVFCIAKSLAARVNDDFRKAKFASAAELDIGALGSEKAILNSILEWFSQSQESEGSGTKSPLKLRPYHNYQDRQGSPLDFLSVAESYCCGKDGRIKALKWIVSFVEHWASGGILRFYTDQSTDWLDVDCEFFRDSKQQNLQIVDKFGIIKILVPDNSPAANHLLIFEFAKLFMDTATVSINFVRQNERSMFQHSFGIYDNNIAISCYGFYAKDYLPTRLHSDERFIHELILDFEANFNSAEVALRFVPRFTIWDLCMTYAEIFTQNANIYYSSPQIFLPFIPAEIINEVLCDTDTKHDSSGLDYVRLDKQSDTFLRQNLLTISISTKAFCFAREGHDRRPYLFVQEDQKVFFTRRQCKIILENIVKKLMKFENLMIIIEDKPIDEYFLIQDRTALLYARTSDRFIPYLSHHPNLVSVVWKKTADDIAASVKDYDRAAVIAQLEGIIRDYL